MRDQRLSDVVLSDLHLHHPRSSTCYQHLLLASIYSSVEALTITQCPRLCCLHGSSQCKMQIFTVDSVPASAAARWLTSTGRWSAGIPRISRKMMKAGVSLRKYRRVKNAQWPPPLGEGKKSSEAAVWNFKAFPLKLPSPGSRAHPCLSDFLRLSPSVSHPLSVWALPPGFLSPCIGSIFFFFLFPSLGSVAPFYILQCPLTSFMTPLNLQRFCFFFPHRLIVCCRHLASSNWSL